LSARDPLVVALSAGFASVLFGHLHVLNQLIDQISFVHLVTSLKKSSGTAPKRWDKRCGFFSPYFVRVDDAIPEPLASCRIHAVMER
jgi:hypothetical protein